MAKKDVIIELKNVSKQYGDNLVVEDFNFYVRKGEFVTFLGPSGCGKTTTLRMIAGFEMPTKGEILLNGKNICDLPPYKRPVNTVFQRYALFPHLDVFDNVAFGLKLKKIETGEVDKKGNPKFRKYTKSEIEEKVKKALKIVDLEEFEWRDINTLSGGQQQRVAIARAIVNEPQILLLDEPLGALDLKMRKEMQLELKEMHKKLGITFIYVTHDQEEALTMSDIIVVMKDGQIQQIGTPMDIYNEPKNAFVADFIGESNIYVGTMIGSKRVRFMGATWNCVDDFPINEKVDVVVRPEDIIIHTDGEGSVKAKIVNKIFKGIHYQYTAMVGNNEVLIQSTIDYPTNITVTLTIEPELIQIMKREYTANIYEDAYINKNNKVVFAGATWDCDVTQLVKGAILDEEGYFITPNGKKYDLNDIDVIATIDMKDVQISDDLESGNITGQIIQMVWKGDHYQLIVRTEDEEDFIVDTEWTWNEFDTVSIKIDESKIKLKLKEDLAKYEI